MFEKSDTGLFGIIEDNIPILNARTGERGGWWLPVLHFRHHGKVSTEYGVPRSDGASERALSVMDKAGGIRSAEVHVINERLPLETLTR